MTNYQQVIHMRRMDYCSARTNDMAFALAAERFKIEVP